jgi:hypothetical protein
MGFPFEAGEIAGGDVAAHRSEALNCTLEYVEGTQLGRNPYMPGKAIDRETDVVGAARAAL